MVLITMPQSAGIILYILIRGTIAVRQGKLTQIDTVLGGKVVSGRGSFFPH
jgi:hypothetical protein